MPSICRRCKPLAFFDKVLGFAHRLPDFLPGQLASGHRRITLLGIVFGNFDAGGTKGRQFWSVAQNVLRQFGGIVLALERPVVGQQETFALLLNSR
jgi:hypothetical protein